MIADADIPCAMIGFPRFAAAVAALALEAGVEAFNKRTLETSATGNPTARLAFQRLTGLEGAPLMDDAKAAFYEAKEALRAAQVAFDQAAFDLVRAGVVETSARYPAREVTMCAAMGITSLGVERHGGYGGDYTIYNSILTEPRRDVNVIEKAMAPDWLKSIYDAEDEFGIKYALGGDQYLTAKGGKIVRDLRHW